jgi:RHS repeat-associated protein
VLRRLQLVAVGSSHFDFVDPDGAGTAPTALSKRYLWGETTDQLFAQEDVSTGTLWSRTDNLGTTRDLVNNAGASATHFTYDAFGKITACDTSKSRFLYTAQEFDPDTGLYYYNARWYDPQAAKFLSQDPIGFAAGDENLSRYVGNSPTNGTDPSGNFSWNPYGLRPRLLRWRALDAEQMLFAAQQ